MMKGDTDIIITYGDIVYTKQVIQSLIASEDPISLGVDLNWYQYWKTRMENPLEDAKPCAFAMEIKLLNWVVNPQTMIKLKANIWV